jgi:hypothetical protein
MIIHQSCSFTINPHSTNAVTFTLPRPGETPEITGGEKEEPAQKSSLARAMEGISSTFSSGEEKKEKERDDKPRFSTVADNLLPKIRRGWMGEEKDDGVVVGWKADVRSRKAREEILR